MEIKDAIETIRNKVNQLFYLLSICKDDDNPEELKIKIDAKKEVDIFIFIRDILGKYARGELVEVVHCKDCKYQNGGTCGYWTDDNYKPAVDDMGYCDNGERK